MRRLSRLQQKTNSSSGHKLPLLPFIHCSVNFSAWCHGLCPTGKADRKPGIGQVKVLLHCCQCSCRWHHKGRAESSFAWLPCVMEGGEWIAHMYFPKMGWVHHWGALPGPHKVKLPDPNLSESSPNIQNQTLSCVFFYSRWHNRGKRDLLQSCPRGEKLCWKWDLQVSQKHLLWAAGNEEGDVWPAKQVSCWWGLGQGSGYGGKGIVHHSHIFFSAVYSLCYSEMDCGNMTQWSLQTK